MYVISPSVRDPGNREIFASGCLFQYHRKNVYSKAESHLTPRHDERIPYPMLPFLILVSAASLTAARVFGCEAVRKYPHFLEQVFLSFFGYVIENSASQTGHTLTTLAKTLFGFLSRRDFATFLFFSLRFISETNRFEHVRLQNLPDPNVPSISD